VEQFQRAADTAISQCLTKSAVLVGCV